MNHITSLLSILVILYCSLSHVSPFSIEPTDVTHIEIYYYAEVFGPEPIISRIYEIEKVDTVYTSSTGKKISPYFVELLLSSLTDLYESDVYEESYDGFVMTDYYPYYRVTITLHDETQIVLESDSNYHCWIPWNVTYNGKTYVQYNGKIPSALIKMLAVLTDRPGDYLVKYGCFPAPVPERYKEKGISSDFPSSTPVVTPEELAGLSHLRWKMDAESSMVVSPLFIGGKTVVLSRDTVRVLDPRTGDLVWKIHCGDIASRPVYKDGTLFITTTEKVMALTFETGTIKWQTRIRGKSTIFWSYPHELLLYDTMLFVGVKGPGVYCFNVYSGDKIWEYGEEGSNYAHLHLIEDKLIVRGSGVRAFEAKTGAKIWEVPGYLYTVEVHGDRILIRTLRSGEGFSWSLLHADSGEVLWESSSHNAACLLYYDRMLYFGNSGRLVCLDTQCMEEVWSYPYTDVLGGIEIIGDTIAFYEYIKKDHIRFITRLVFLDFNGDLIWQRTYEVGERDWSSYILNIPFYAEILFFIRDNTIEAVARDTGEHIWVTEVRGSYVSSFDVHGNALYVTSDDSRLYCIDVNTGVIQWYYELEKEIFYFDMSNVLDPQFSNNFIAVATRKGDIFLFSHHVVFSPLVPRESGLCIE